MFISTKLRVVLRKGAPRKMGIKSTTGLTEVHVPCCSVQGEKKSVENYMDLVTVTGTCLFFFLCRSNGFYSPAEMEMKTDTLPHRNPGKFMTTWHIPTSRLSGWRRGGGGEGLILEIKLS